MRKLLAVLTFALAIPALPGTVGAHVEVSPVKAPAARPVDFKFTVGHGCDGAATRKLIVRIPEGVSGARAEPVPGWKVGSTGDRLTWSGGSLGDHDRGDFPFRATLSGGQGDLLAFKVIQRCEQGEETAWIQTAGPDSAAGEGGQGALEHPAPVVRLTSSGELESQAEIEADSTRSISGNPAAGAGDRTEDPQKDRSDGPLLPVIGLILTLAAAATYILVHRSGRSD